LGEAMEGAACPLRERLELIVAGQRAVAYADAYD